MDQSLKHGLSRRTAIVLWFAVGLALLHHMDHVLRVDHSGWPFRADVTPFTYSLLAYPVLLFALFGPVRLLWLRWVALSALTAATLSAHIFLESPQMQYAMWANDRSIDPHGAGFHNFLYTKSPTAGVIAVAIAMALNLTAVLSSISMFFDGVEFAHDAKAQSKD